MAQVIGIFFKPKVFFIDRKYNPVVQVTKSGLVIIGVHSTYLRRGEYLYNNVDDLTNEHYNLHAGNMMAEAYERVYRMMNGKELHPNPIYDYI